MDWVWIRGLGRESRHWNDLPQWGAAQLDARIRSVDLPGFGQHTDKAAPLRLEDNVATVRRTEAPRGRRRIVLGHSLGGMVALAWALHFPEEIQGLVLVNTSLANLSSPQQRMRPDALGEIFRVLQIKDPAEREARILRLIANNEAARRAHHQHWAELAAVSTARRRDVLRQMVAAAGFMPQRQLLKQLGCTLPIQVLYGQGDRLVDPSCSLRLADALGCPVVGHPDAGHDIAIDAKTWFIEQLKRFQASIPLVADERSGAAGASKP